MILTLERLRKPKPREAVTWFPNQWVAAVDLEPRPYIPARGRDTRKEEGGWAFTFAWSF